LLTRKRQADKATVDRMFRHGLLVRSQARRGAQGRKGPVHEKSECFWSRRRSKEECSRNEGVTKIDECERERVRERE
jgi:hypothetical protein